MRWKRRAADPAALDGDFLNLLFAPQGFLLSSLSRCAKFCCLTARAYHMVRNSAAIRFMAMLLLSAFIYTFLWAITQLSGRQAGSGPEYGQGFPGAGKRTAFCPCSRGTPICAGISKKSSPVSNCCPEDMAWCRRFYETSGVCAPCSVRGYPHQFHFALGSVGALSAQGRAGWDELMAAMFRSNSCFLLLRKGDR